MPDAATRDALNFYGEMKRRAADHAALSRPFPLTEAYWIRQYDEETDWDDVEEEEEDEDFWEEYPNLPEETAKRLNDGRWTVCHYGCGIQACLIVTGAAAGQVWRDDLCNRVGLTPFADYEQDYPLYGASVAPDRPTSFLDWYEGWLDTALAVE